MKILFIAFAALGALLGCLEEQDYHAHADFAVILDAQAVDFNKAQYMSTPYRHLSENVHLHDFDPGVVHFHAGNIPLGEFFQSLEMEFTKDCFDTNTAKYCSNENSKLYFYVNGRENSQYGNYVPTDLDKILIYYGTNKPSEETLDSITNKSCIYSKKCTPPEGFILPEESCSVGKPCTLEGT